MSRQNHTSDAMHVLNSGEQKAAAGNAQKLNRRKAISMSIATAFAIPTLPIAALALPKTVLVNDQQKLEQMRVRWLEALEAYEKLETLHEEEWERVQSLLPAPDGLIVQCVYDGHYIVHSERSLRDKYGSPNNTPHQNEWLNKRIKMMHEYQAMVAKKEQEEGLSELKARRGRMAREVDASEEAIASYEVITPASIALKLEVWITRRGPDSDDYLDAMILNVHRLVSLNA